MSRLIDYSKCRAATEAMASEDLEQSLTSFHATGQEETARRSSSRRRSSGSHARRRTSISGSNHGRLPAAVFHDSFSSVSTAPMHNNNNNNSSSSSSSSSSILQAKLHARLSGAASPVDVTSSLGRMQMQAGSCYSPPLSPVTNPKPKVRRNSTNQRNLNRRSSGVSSPPISPAGRRSSGKVPASQARRSSLNTRNPLHSIYYQQQQSRASVPSVPVLTKPKAPTAVSTRTQTTNNIIDNAMDNTIISWNRGNRSAFAVVLDSPEIIEVQLAEMPGQEPVETTTVNRSRLKHDTVDDEPSSTVTSLEADSTHHDQQGRCLSPAYQRRQKMTWLANQTPQPQLLHKTSAALSANNNSSGNNSHNARCPPISVVKIITHNAKTNNEPPTRFREKLPVPPSTEYASPPLSRQSSFQSSSQSSSSSSQSGYSSMENNISWDDLDHSNSSSGGGGSHNSTGSRLRDHQSWSLRTLVDTTKSPHPVVNTRRSSASFVAGSQIRTITLPF